jgi:cytochrome c oxidase subunit II
VQKLWSVLFGVVLSAAFASFVVAYFVKWWLPRDISKEVGFQVDLLFYLILALTGVVYVLTEAVLVWNLWRYGAQEGGKSSYSHGNHKLEWTWSTVTAVILLLIAVGQISAWNTIKNNTQGEHVIEVSARQFEWRIRYPSEDRLAELTNKDGKLTVQEQRLAERKWNDQPDVDDVRVVNELHTWAGAKVRVLLKTRDVIHSFFLPNLRIKQDALPGKPFIPVWFQVRDDSADPKGTPPTHNIEWDDAKKQWKIDTSQKWDLACAELCGWGHGKMQGRLFVHKDRADYERWLQEARQKQDAVERDERDKPAAP